LEESVNEEIRSLSELLDQTNVRLAREHDTLRRQNQETQRMLLAIHELLARSESLRRRAGVVESQLEVTQSGRIKLILSPRQRKMLWQGCKLAVTLAAGAGATRFWSTVARWIAAAAH
jgi:hypothetical protein